MADFAKIFHKTPEIFTLKASRYGNLCTSAPSLAALGIAGTSSALLSLTRAVVDRHPTENRRDRVKKKKKKIGQEKNTRPTVVLF